VLRLARIQAFPVLAIVSPEGPRGPAELLLNFVIAFRNVLGEGKYNLSVLHPTMGLIENKSPDLS
jgi:hypothetical protein